MHYNIRPISKIALHQISKHLTMRLNSSLWEFVDTKDNDGISESKKRHLLVEMASI